jgi:hypothetical protein
VPVPIYVPDFTPRPKAGASQLSLSLEQTVRLRVSIDIDGVQTDPKPVWHRYLNSRAQDCGHALIPETGLVVYDWDYYDKLCQPCFKAGLIEPQNVHGCVPYPEFVAALPLLAVHCDLSVLTHRNSAIQADTIQWHAQAGIAAYFREHIFERGSKFQVAYDKHVHYHVDDSPNVIADFNAGRTAALARGVDEERLPRLLKMNHPYNQGLPAHRDFDDWSELAEFLVREAIAYNDKLA